VESAVLVEVEAAVEQRLHPGSPDPASRIRGHESLKLLLPHGCVQAVGDEGDAQGHRGHRGDGARFDLWTQVIIKVTGVDVANHVTSVRGVDHTASTDEGQPDNPAHSGICECELMTRRSRVRR
jgi:hypothetical protein